MTKIQPFFKITRKRIVESHTRIIDLELDLPGLLADLMQKDKFEQLAASERDSAKLQGIGCAVVALVGFFAAPILGVLLLLVAGYSLWRAKRAHGRLEESNTLWGRAVHAMMSLEGEEGFLWRYEHLLEDWGLDLSDELRKTLGPICTASKDKSLSPREDMYYYWHWILFLEGRMKYVFSEMDKIDPEGLMSDITLVASQEYKDSQR